MTRLIYLILLYAFTGPCKTDWHYYEGSCYLFKLDGDKKNWIGAADACTDEEAGLVRIESQAEDDFILAKVEELIDDVTGVFIFTAGNDRETEGSWVWSGASKEEVGEPLQYMNWFMGEPSGMVIENCLSAYPMHKTWVDIQCDNINYYICEDQNPVL